jgi:hypothetical protein
MLRYSLECILNIQDEATLKMLKNAIIEFTENLEINPASEDNLTHGKDFKICMQTQDPTIIFDTCAQFGRLKSVKVEEKK